MSYKHLNLDYEPTKPREVVIKLLCEGLTYKEIAHKKDVSYRSIQDMLYKIYKETNCRDRIDLVVWSIKKGYLKI